jgi:undecaprenyl-phosphate 4-deoxy-4-formamido-L-arabinose transferase
MKTISFVIPCYASEGSVALVMDEIRAVVGQREGYDYEIVAVNDCSPDNVMEVLRQQAEADPKVKVVNLARNGGRHCALMAGFHVTCGDYVVCIDDDLQCPTDQVWNLLAPLERGDYDAAIARYRHKQQSALKNLGSQFHDRVSNWLLEKDKDLKFSNFSAMRRFVRDEVIRYKNPYPYISGLMLRATSRVCNVDMEERSRTIGEGHYTLKKSFALWTNSFTAFSVKPLRLSLFVGCVCAVLGLIDAIYTVVHKLVNPAIPAGYSSTMAAILFIGGMILFMLGLIGEYVGRIYISLNNSPQFVVRETLNVDEEGKERLTL